MGLSPLSLNPRLRLGLRERGDSPATEADRKERGSVLLRMPDWCWTVYGLSLGLGRQLLVPAAYWEPLSGSYN